MRTRWATAATACALILGGVACSSDGDTSDATTTVASADGPTTTTEQASTTAATESTDVAETTEQATTTEPERELGYAVIRPYVETEHPDLGALVDWDVFTWTLGYGYQATIPTGSTVDQAIAVCEAIAEIADDYESEDQIAVGLGDYTADPIVARESPDGTCAAL